MTATPTTSWMKLARRLGCDGNPLRRRYDRIEAWLVPASVAVFVVMCPVVAAVSNMWIRADNAAVQRAEVSWHRVPATLLQAVPGPEQTDHGANTWAEWAPAKWTVDGRRYTGEVPAAAGSRADSVVTVFLGPGGQVQLPPMTAAQVSIRARTTTVITLFVIAVLLAVLTGLARRFLDHRKLVGWEAAWLAVGPRWSRQT